MNEIDLDRLGRGAVTRLRAEAERIAESRTELASLLDREGPMSDPAHNRADVPVVDSDRERRGRPWWPALAAAAVLATVGGIAFVTRPAPGSVVSTTQPPAVGDVVTIRDDVGPQLDRTVLATFGFGDGPGKLGFEHCDGCEPVRPFAPAVADDGTIFLADTYNDRWQVFRDGSWSGAPYQPGEAATGAPVVGPDGLLYAPVADGGWFGARVVALDPNTFGIVDTYPIPKQAEATIDVVNGSIVVGGHTVHAPPTLLGMPTWHVDQAEHEITVALSGVAATFRLPDRWELEEAAAIPDDGSVVFHIRAPSDSGQDDWFLLRLWTDSTWATGSIGAEPFSADSDGRFTRTGFVQLEDAIVEYAIPTPDPLTRWASLEPPSAASDPAPRLLPDIPAGGTAYRSAFEWAQPIPEYVQTWVRADETDTVTGVVVATTTIGQPGSTYEGEQIEIEIGLWRRAALLPLALSGRRWLDLESARGSVRLFADGLTADELIAIAADLDVAPAGTGWATPTSADKAPWQLVGGGWRGAAARSAFWWSRNESIMEVVAFTGQPDFLTGRAMGFLDDNGIGPARLETVDGVVAVRHGNEFVDDLIWQPAPGTLYVVATVELDSLEVAETIRLVDEATWQAAADVNPGGNMSTGCKTLVIDC